MHCSIIDFIVFSILLSLTAFCYAGSSVEQDLTITNKEKRILDKLRQRILPRLTHEYIQTDIYLVRWLRARDFDIDRTEKMILDSLQWRKENGIDDLDKLDWSYFKQGFAYTVDSVNNKGQPLLIIDNVKWDVRGVILQGRREKLILWMVKMLEDATKKVREMQAQGKNVTRFSMVNTLENFNIIESGCLQCLSIYTAFSTNYETYYPNMMDDMILVNTPSIFGTVMSLIRPILSPGTRDSLRLMGTNKEQWQAQLRAEIPIDQLPVDFGGQKQSGGDGDDASWY